MENVNYYFKNKTNLKKFVAENNKKIKDCLKQKFYNHHYKYYNDNLLLYKLLKQNLKIVNKIFNVLLTKEYFNIVKKDYIDYIDVDYIYSKNIIDFYENLIYIFELENYNLNNILINDTFRNILYNIDYCFYLGNYKDNNLIDKFKNYKNKSLYYNIFDAYYYEYHNKTFENYRIIP
jgi:hypothetical protein